MPHGFHNFNGVRISLYTLYEFMMDIFMMKCDRLLQYKGDIQENWINTKSTDALARQVAAMALIMYKKRTLVFLGVAFNYLCHLSIEKW